MRDPAKSAMNPRKTRIKVFFGKTKRADQKESPKKGPEKTSTQQKRVATSPEAAHGLESPPARQHDEGLT